MATALYETIRDQVRKVPAGRVTSYGEIAKAAGMPRGAQVVGWALRSLPPGSDVPWQRIVNKKGRISIVNPRLPKTLQRTLLEEEGVGVILRRMGGMWWIGDVGGHGSRYIN